MTDRLSLAGWSLVRRFRRPDDPLALFDFPRVARAEFGFDAVELNSPFFAAHEGAYVEELRRLADQEGVALLGIAVDGAGDLAALDAAARREAVARHLPWLDAGVALGCRFVRANLGGRATPDPQAAVRAAGYAGAWGIEYEGKGDERDGIARSKQVMRELLGLA